MAQRSYPQTTSIDWSHDSYLIGCMAKQKFVCFQDIKNDEIGHINMLSQVYAKVGDYSHFPV